jgi:pyruvate dehydrogenase E2 component (dihydrolipoamide acetyltransferase)
LSAYEFKLPDIGEGVVEGEVVRWLVKEGDLLAHDQPMVEVMTDKATVEIPAPRAGRVLKRMFAEGDRCPVGKVLIVIDAGAAEGGAAVAVGGSASGPAAPSRPAVGAAPAAASGPAGAVLATPATRKLARDLGVDLRAVTATGPAGRVTSDDVRAHKQNGVAPAAARPAPAPAAADRRVPFRGVRKKIAEALARSKFTAPHATYVEEVDCTELVALRNAVNGRATAAKVSYLPFIIKATAAALKKFPQMNATLDDAAGEIVQWGHVHMGLATATDAGLIVPVIRDADRKSIAQLSTEIAHLAEVTRTGKATRDELTGSTFTITSLGAWGGVMATAIINPPEVAILGVHRIARRPAVDLVRPPAGRRVRRRAVRGRDQAPARGAGGPGRRVGLMAARKTPPSGPAAATGAPPTSRHIRAGLGDPALAEVVAWTDEEYARATQIDRGEGVRELDAQALRDAYRVMLQARALDAAAAALVAEGRIGSYASTQGIEAAVAGAVAGLTRDDMVAAGRRSGVAALYRGWPAAGFVAQLFGNADDLARGRRLPGCPAIPRALNVVPGSSHAGTQLPHAAGIAWAAKMQRKPIVTLGYLDPQEVDAEDFHTGLNFAGVFRLPVVFVCLNDRPASPMKTSETIAIRALAYGIAGSRVDGADLVAVWAQVRAAAERARRGQGATLIEAVIEPGANPLAASGARLAAAKVLDARAASDLQAAAVAEVAAAVEAARQVGAPAIAGMIEGVTAQPSAALRAQLDEVLLRVDRAGRLPKG